MIRAMTLQIESDIRAPRKSRTHLASLRPDLEPHFDDVVLVVSELVSNSVRHGPPGELAVKVEAQDDHVRVEVTDHGEGFELEAPRGNGLGLTLVEKISRSWGVINDGRFTVWAEIPKDRPPEG